MKNGRSRESARAPIGLVLAGGLGTRLGGPGKPFIELAGRPMFERVFGRLSSQVDQIVVGANADPDRFRAYRAPVVADTIPGHSGPLAGVLAGLRWTATHRPDARFIVSVAADTPFFPKTLVSDLTQARGSDARTIVLAASATGVHPVFGLWPVALADDLEAFLRSGANPKVTAFADRHFRAEARFEDGTLPDGTSFDPFFNVNAPPDLARAERIAAALDAVEKP
jgi:molybdopterin-guanine dinucleotide biosynthesis protein A